MADAERRVCAAVADYVREHSLRAGAAREHVRSAVRLDAGLFGAVVSSAVARGALAEHGALLAPPGHAPTLTAEQATAADAFCAALEDGGASPGIDRMPPPDVVAHLVEIGRVVDAGGGVYFGPRAYAEMVAALRAHLAEHGTITLAETRDLLQTSRKYAQALLEHLDSTHVTRRTGDARSLR